MNKNKKLVAQMAVAMTGVMIAGQAAPVVYAEKESLQKDSGVKKEETVYVKADPDGEASEVIVSNWLKNPDGAEQLEDTSDLTEIENVKGEEGFTQDGDKITWAAGGNDIYYQGKSEKELPVSVNVTYYLDGQKIEPEELAGKSGHVKMVFDYKNKVKQGEIYTPFAMVTGLILPGEKFSNVEAVNGRVISDGEKNIVIGIGVPGMNENLNLKDSDLLKDLDIDFPESFEIEADTENFELTMSMTVASNLNLSELNLDDIADKDELQDKIDEMKDGATQLVDGTGELADGVQELKDSCQELIDGMVSVDEGMGTLDGGIAELNTKKNDLVDGINELADGINTLNRKKGDLISGVNQLANGLNTLNNGKGSLVSGVKELANGLKQVDNGAASLKSGAGALADGAETLDSSKEQLIAGIDQLADGINGDGTKKNPGLLNGAKSLAAGLDQLAVSVNGSNNPGSLSKGAAQLKAGLAQLKGKLPEIANGVQSIKGGIDQVAADNGSLASVIGQMQGYLAGDAASQPGFPDESAALEAVDSGADQTADAAADSTFADAAPDMVTEMQAALDANKNVLANLQEVKATAGTVKLPDSMGALANTYNGYVAELDSCIAQMEAAIASQESALAQMRTTQIPAAAPVKEQMTETAASAAVDAENDATGQDTVAVSRTDLAGWLQKLMVSEGTLKAISSNMDGFAEQLGNGTSEKPGLAGAVTQLEKGADSLSAAVDGPLAGAVSQLKTGADTLAAGVGQMANGMNSTYDSNGNPKKMGLKDGMHALGQGISQAASGAKDLESGSKDLKTGTGKLRTGAGKLQSGAGTLSAGVEKLASGAGKLQAGADTLGSGVQQLADGGAQLRSGGGTLADGIEQLASGSGELKEGTGKLAEGGSELGEGVDKLNDGAIELKDGMDEFNEKAVEKITDLMENDLEDFIDRLDAIRKAGESYTSFSGDETGSGNVKFIIETGSIEAK